MSTNSRIFERPLSVKQSCEWLDELCSHPRAIMLHPGKAHAAILKHLLASLGTGGNLVSDAHLAALALEQDATIVTGDRDFLRFAGLKLKFLY